MKSRKTFTTTLLLIVIALFWTACKKEVSQQATTQQSTNNPDAQNTKAFGAIQVDPEAMSKVPLIISPEFQARRGAPVTLDEVSAARGGKPLRGDIIPPTISIISPSNGAIVVGTVTVQVNASDNVGVNSVGLSIDGTVVTTSINSPFTNSWNSASVANGTHTLTVTATDAAGNKGTSSIQVTVNNSVSNGDLISPTVSFISPADLSSVTGSVNVNISASDNVGVSSRSISIDNSVVSTSSSYSWNTSNYSSGSHILTATAKDAAGNVGANSITVTVNTITLPPPSIPTSHQIVMPPLIYQGGEGSCVAFATVYARSAEQYYRTSASSYSQATNILSPEFLFDQTKTSTSCSGSALLTSFDFLKSTGVCTWQSMPYSYVNGCSLVPTSQQTSEAANYKIASYSQVYNTDVQAIKTMLASNHPLVSVYTIDNNFYYAGPGFIWKSFGTAYGSHALAICGYDDAMHAYKVINQWGSTWGDTGYSWIDYDFLPVVSSNLLVMNY